MKIDGWKTILSLFLADIREFVGRVHLQKHTAIFSFFYYLENAVAVNFHPLYP